jgi:Uma2 family endonuclease
MTRSVSNTTAVRQSSSHPGQGRNRGRGDRTDVSDGGVPSSSAAAIYRSLWDYQLRVKSGRAYTDNTGFLVDVPQRKSFSPDACFYVGPPPGPRFLQGAPTFAAGAQVVWDVDVLREALIRAYRAAAPDTPTVYRRGERAEAAPALPGWSFPVDEIFE